MALLVALVGIGCAPPPEHPAAVPTALGKGTTMIVNVTEASGRMLDIQLTNDTGKALEVFKHSLPWVGFYSIVLVAVKTDAPGTVLERATPVDDPIVGTVTIQPGETLSGKIELDRHFPGLAGAIGQRDVVVFWTYQLQTVDGAGLPRQGGWVLLKH
jgi:hypothetical protein